MASTVDQYLQASLGDRYRIEREIARGGMATVYLATDLRHDRKVALKVMHPEVALALGRERFLREIRLTAKLSHPNILPVHDSGEAGDCLWYVMPYVEGETLRNRLENNGPLLLDEALRLMREAAEAVGHAHSLGVVHRDIKPENILLSRGHAVIADFGIARAIDASKDERITTGGFTLGTTAYMSPEQSLAEEVDARTDVWALGCVLYEMLCGKPPFGSGGREVLTRSLTGRPDAMRAIRPDIPEEVERIVEKALAREPAYRFGTATELASALDGFRTQEGEANTRKRRISSLALIATIAIVVLAGGMLLWSQRNGNVSKVSASPTATAPRLSSDSVARELFRQARAQQARRTVAGSMRAITLLSQAIARDSSFARAWAELARVANYAYSRAHDIPGFTQDSLISLAVAASQRAVELSPDDPDSWLVKGTIGFLVDPVLIEPRIFAVRKALELDSTNAGAWFNLGVIRQETLDDTGALAAWKHATTLGPSDPQTLSFIALHYLWNAKPDSGVKWADSAIVLDPTYLLARDAAGQLALELDRPLDAIRHYEVALRLTSGRERGHGYAMLARAHARLGDSTKARDYANRAVRTIDAKKPVKHEAAYVAAGLAAVGDTVRAVRLLKAYEPRGDVHYQLHLKRDPGLRWLRGKWGKDLLLPDPKKL